MRLCLRAGLLIACLTVSGSALAQAAEAEQTGQSASDDRAQTFQAVSGGVKEDVAGGPLMLGAYAIVWVALFGYVFRMVRMQRGVEADVSRLERSLSSER